MLRKVVLAAALLALAAGTAAAQFPAPGLSLGHDKPPPTPEQIERQKAIDNAYNAASRKIPEKKATADPWGNIRPSGDAAARGKQ